MRSFSPEVISKLNLLQQKKLGKGEVFLLSKAIADNLPLAPIETDNIKLFTINYRNYINEVIFSISDYSYIDDETVKTIYRLIDELSLWRYNIAHNPPAIFFKGDNNTVVDDISCLLRYVDVTHICSVSDIADKANWLFNMFKDVAKEIKIA